MLNKTADYLGPFKILLIEPNPLMRRITRGVLQVLGARRIVETENVNTAATFLRQGDIDFVLCEWYLAGSYGVDLIRWLRQENSDVRFTPFIMITSQTRLESVTTARNAGITEFVAKPFSAKSLTSRVREVIERPRPFVSIGRYFGPDRRRRAEVLAEKAERRSAGALLIAGNSLTQEQINSVVAGSGQRRR
jgi:DNA-binding response OmpR family regulator